MSSAAKGFIRIIGLILIAVGFYLISQRSRGAIICVGIGAGLAFF